MGHTPKQLLKLTLPRIARECGHVPSLKGNKAATIGLTFVSEEKMKELNRVYRGKNCPTDVLSFGAEGSSRSFVQGDRGTEDRELGDIAICPKVAIREAKRRSIDPGEELARLITHGVLHLAGMDHATPREERRMFALQEAIVEKVI